MRVELIRALAIAAIEAARAGRVEPVLAWLFALRGHGAKA